MPACRCLRLRAGDKNHGREGNRCKPGHCRSTVAVDGGPYDTICPPCMTQEIARVWRICGIDISSDASKKNLEGKFNKEFVRRRPNAILFDRAKLKIGAGRKDKDFCYILDLTDDGMIRIVNVKQFKDAYSINYLFAQSNFYCEAFLQDEVFLSEIRGHVAASACGSKDRYLDYIKDTVEAVRGEACRVCLWLLYRERDPAPTKDDIPLISQYELKLMHDHLKRVCKFDDVVMRFVPVVTKQYTTRKTPKPKGG